MATGYLLALTVPVSAVALVYARWEYRKRGRLTPLGLFLLCAEHLRRVFGQPCVDYCRRVPRYLRLGPVRF